MESYAASDSNPQSVAFVHRISVHESRGFTSYFLIHGRETLAPFDRIYEPPIQTTAAATLTSCYANKIPYGELRSLSERICMQPQNEERTKKVRI